MLQPALMVPAGLVALVLIIVMRVVPAQAVAQVMLVAQEETEATVLQAAPVALEEHHLKPIQQLVLL
jgi:hypothetical protein